MIPNTIQQAAPSPVRVFFGWVGVVILLGMFVTALFGDIFVWAIYGTKFVLSPGFRHVEGWLRGLIGVSFMSFFALEKGAEHLQQKRWKPLLFGSLMFIFASLPLAKSCALLVRFATVNGLGALAQPKYLSLVLLAMLIFSCKCRAGFILWRLIRMASEPRETRRIVIENNATLN